MATGRERDADVGAGAPARASAGSVGHVLAASAVRLLEQDVDVGDAQTQQAVDDAVEAIAARLVRLADLCQGTQLADRQHGPPLDEAPPPRASWPRRPGGGW